MSQDLSKLKFASSHEWISVDAEGIATIGISEHAQDLLGDVVFVEVPEVDTELSQGDDAGVVESVKAASDIYAPISGTVVAVNEALEDEPELVNADAYQAWFFKVQLSDVFELDNLLDADAYAAQCAAEN